MRARHLIELMVHRRHSRFAKPAPINVGLFDDSECFINAPIVGDVVEFELSFKRKVKMARNDAEERDQVKRLLIDSLVQEFYQDLLPHVYNIKERAYQHDDPKLRKLIDLLLGEMYGH